MYYFSFRNLNKLSFRNTSANAEFHIIIFLVLVLVIHLFGSVFVVVGREDRVFMRCFSVICRQSSELILSLSNLSSPCPT